MSGTSRIRGSFAATYPGDSDPRLQAGESMVENALKGTLAAIRDRWVHTGVPDTSRTSASCTSSTVIISGGENVC